MEEYTKEFETVTKGTIAKFTQELQGIRSGRPSPLLLENIKVQVYGITSAAKELGTITIKPPREIDLTVWDHTIVTHVMKAIQDAQLGFTPVAEGNTIRCFLPPLTEERRLEIGKQIKKMAEEVRIKIRTYRDDAIKKLKAGDAEKKLNEDQVFSLKDAIQKQVDIINKEVQKLVDAKLKELQE